MKTIAIAGSTGSIGTQALEVIAESPEDFEVAVLGANSSTELLIDQANKFHPKYVCLFDESHSDELKSGLNYDCQVVCGRDSVEVLSTKADLVLNAIVGFAGLSVTLNSLRADKILALANKESLVAAGDVVDKIKKKSNGEIIPVDSEHSAIFQCLKNEKLRSINKILLTGSGGPFRGKTLSDLSEVKIDEALNHPTWNMGPKITVDSSTLMNKALEIIEAKYLFDISTQDIEVVIHRQSIVHSMVTFADGATMAQLAMPTMCLPISYALNYPDRGQVSYGMIDFGSGLELSFEKPNRNIFRSLGFGYEAGRVGKNLPTIINAANEVAVQAFLDERLSWLKIFDVVEHCIQTCSIVDLNSEQDVFDSDFEARRIANSYITIAG